MKNFLHGSAYYPEQWGLSSLGTDIAVMKKLGLNCVRMAEFAWAVLEPKEGEFDFSLFDEAIDRLYRSGIYTILGTPTSTPPRWFTLKYPLSAVVDSAGRVMAHGSRMHVCVNDADYLRHSLIIAEKIAEHYAKNPAVVAYQIHNEPGSPVSECFCPSCRAKWAKYLKERYGNIDNLNKAWHNGIWSFTYPDFESVPPPESTPYLHSTSHLSAYRDFYHTSIAEFISAQAKAVRKYTDVPLTTNVYVGFDLDFEKCFSDLDFASIDEYSTLKAYPESTMAFDLFRGLCDKPFAVMETPPTSSGNRVEVLPYHAPHYVAALSLSSCLGGGKGFLYWQYRQSAGGAEAGHGHIINACGNPTPAFTNVSEASKALDAYADFLANSTPAKADTAVFYSSVSQGFARVENFKEYHGFLDFSQSYRSLVKTGVYRDIITEKDDFSPYKLIYVPYAVYLSETAAKKLHEAATGGATVIIGAYSGTRTREHTLHTDFTLGCAERFLPKHSLHFSQLGGQGKIKAFNTGTGISGHVAVFEKSKTSRGIIEGGFCDGLSAVEEFEIGKGKWVIACFKAEPGFEQAMLAHYADDVGAARKKFDYGIAYYRRLYRGERVNCYVNMSDKTLNIESENGSVPLRAGACAVFDGKGHEII